MIGCSYRKLYAMRVRVQINLPELNNIQHFHMLTGHSMRHDLKLDEKCHRFFFYIVFSPNFINGIFLDVSVFLKKRFLDKIIILIS